MSMRRPCRPRRPSGAVAGDAPMHVGAGRYLRGANKRIPITGRHTSLHTPLLKVDAEAIRHPPTISIRRCYVTRNFLPSLRGLLLGILFFSFFFFLLFSFFFLFPRKETIRRRRKGDRRGRDKFGFWSVERMKFFFSWNGEGLLETLYYIGDIILLGDLTRYVRHVS